jgi:hypothetical protein
MAKHAGHGHCPSSLTLMSFAGEEGHVCPLLSDRMEVSGLTWQLYPKHPLY